MDGVLPLGAAADDGGNLFKPVRLHDLSAAKVLLTGTDHKNDLVDVGIFFKNQDRAGKHRHTRYVDILFIDAAAHPAAGSGCGYDHRCFSFFIHGIQPSSAID